MAPTRGLLGQDAICYFPKEGSNMMITAHAHSPHMHPHIHAHPEPLISDSQAIWCDHLQGSQVWVSGAEDMTRGGARLLSFYQQERSLCNTLN